MWREDTGGRVGQTKSSQIRIIVRDSQLRRRRKISSTNESVLISLLDFSSWFLILSTYLIYPILSPCLLFLVSQVLHGKALDEGHLRPLNWYVCLWWLAWSVIDQWTSVCPECYPLGVIIRTQQYYSISVTDDIEYRIHRRCRDEDHNGWRGEGDIEDEKPAE